MKIRLKNNIEFNCQGDKTIFDSAVLSGITLNHSCLEARCRTCLARVIKGKTISIKEDLVLTNQEREDGYILTCNTLALTNLELDIEEIDFLNFIPRTTIPVKIDYIEYFSKNIAKLVLRAPPNSKFKFVPGQYVKIIKGNVKRSYSISNAPRKDNKFEFYIKNYSGGYMSDYFFKNAIINDLLRIEGPIGSFYFKPTNKKILLFIATGTGIGPIKAILDQLEENPEQVKNKSVYLVWGVRDIEDIFCLPNYNKIELTYISTVSADNLGWNGEKSYVQQVVLNQNIDLNDAVVYACGSMKMINSASKLFFENGLSVKDFFSDAFIESD
jgi:CDP-4-dehydro-6-deoxyglucose reductase